MSTLNLSSLPKLILKTRVITHSVDLPNSAIASNLQGGFSRMRANVLNGPAFVTVSWVTKNDIEYDYLMAFYMTLLKEGALPFLLKIPVLSAACDWVECQFVPGSFKMSGRSGSLRTVVAKVEVLDKRNEEDDQQLLALVGASESFDEVDHDEFINILDHFTNTEFADHMVVK